MIGFYPFLREGIYDSWMRMCLPKRAIYAHLYGDLFETEGLSVLDIGGGFNGLSDILAERHNYEVYDIDSHNALPERDWIIKQDWAKAPLRTYDIVIANDVFPNVDQRYEYVVEQVRFLVSLTFYVPRKTYRARRVDAEEILTIQTPEVFPWLDINDATAFPHGRYVWVGEW